jgi:hypothetical protein
VIKDTNARSTAITAARQPMTFPITLSLKCVDAGDDRYEEILLGEDLLDDAGAVSDEVTLQLAI